MTSVLVRDKEKMHTDVLESAGEGTWVRQTGDA